MDVLGEIFPEVQAEINDWSVEFDRAVASSDIEDLARFHAYDSDKFVRVDSNMSRMDAETGRIKRRGVLFGYGTN